MCVSAPNMCSLLLDVSSSAELVCSLMLFGICTTRQAQNSLHDVHMCTCSQSANSIAAVQLTLVRAFSDHITHTAYEHEYNMGIR